MGPRSQFLMRIDPWSSRGPLVVHVHRTTCPKWCSFGMWLGGLIGFSVGLISFYLGKRFLLVGFIVSQLLLFVFLSTFTTETSQLTGSLAIIGLDITEAGMKVVIFAILMALCTTQTSATNFGIFMGFSNLSIVVGNSIAPLLIELLSYDSTYIFAGLSLIPCIVLAFYLTASKN